VLREIGNGITAKFEEAQVTYYGTHSADRGRHAREDVILGAIHVTRSKDRPQRRWFQDIED